MLAEDATDLGCESVEASDSGMLRDGCPENALKTGMLGVFAESNTIPLKKPLHQD